MKIIFDTDIGWMNDDAIAALMALHAPEVEVLGITPVMGNYDQAFSVAASLRLLEMTGYERVPVCPGFDRPLVHERSAYADASWGEWATFKKDFELPPGPPRLKADPRHACDFIVESILAYPGEVTVIAVGPLTNLAVAVRKAPHVVGQVRQVIVIGGALALFPYGWGNSTPLAEFNFWVDPEAARIVIRAGLPLTMLPLNLCRQTHLPLAMIRAIVNSPTVKPDVVGLFRDYILPLFDSQQCEDHLAYGLYDSTALAFALRPDLFETTTLCVDVLTSPGPQYGMALAFKPGMRIIDDENIFFPIVGSPPVVTVAHKVDFDAMTALYLTCVGA